MTNMAAMHIYGQNFQNLLQNQLVDDLDNWYVASGTIATNV